MTAKTRADLNTQLDADLASNSVGNITALKVRTMLTDVMDSAIVGTENTQTVLLKTGNLAGLDAPSTALDNLGAGATGKTLFLSTDAATAQQAMDVEVGVDVQGVLSEGPFVDGDKTKLDGIGAGANVTSVNGNTGVVVLDPDDLDDTATTNKFVTAADLTTLSNTSGTNTGDQDLSTYQLKPAEGAFVDGDKTALDAAILDSDFSTNGLMERTGAGAYGTATDGTDYLSPTTGTLAYANRTAIKAAGLSAGVTVFNRETNYQDPYTLTSGDYSSEVDDYATLTDDAIANTTAAWVRRFNRDPRPQDFGGTDQASVQRCITYAERETGAMELVGSYTLNDEIAIDSDLQIYGKRGKSILDFSSKSAWSYNTFDGLIRFEGSRGTGIALSQNVAARTGPLARITAGSRSSTTITFDTEIPHGLAVGDPVWTQSDVHSTLNVADAIFFAYNSAVGGALGQTSPFIVASTPTTTRFTVTCADTGATTLSAGSVSAPLYVYYAANVIIVADTSGFTQGDEIQIGSTDVRTVSGGGTYQIGERQVIARVDAAIDALILHTEVRDSYLTADTAKAYPLTTIEGSVKDLVIRGKGPNTGGTYGDRGILFSLVNNPTVSGVKFEEVDQMGVLTRNCKNVGVTHNHMAFNATDAGGQSSGDLDIQYGFADDSSEGGVWAYNHVYGGRHAWDQSGTSATSEFGISRGLVVANNTFLGQWWSAIATHEGTEKLTIVNNHIWGAHTGIDVRWCDDVTIKGNFIKARHYGVLAKTYVSRFDVSDNPRIEGGISAVRIMPAESTETGTEYFSGPITVNRNYLYGGETGVYIDDTLNDREAYIEVDENLIEGCSQVPIDIRIAASTGATGYFNGSVSRNHIRGLNIVTAETAVIDLRNALNVEVVDNKFDLPSSMFSYAVRIYGNMADYCRVDGSKFISNEPTTATLSLPSTGETTFYGKDVPVQYVAIASGVLTIDRKDDHYILVRGEGNVADELDAISGLQQGQRITLFRYSEAITIRAGGTSGLGSSGIQITGGSSISLNGPYKSVTILGTNIDGYAVVVNDTQAT